MLVTNVRVFDGTSDKLTGKTNVLVENNLIKAISTNAKAGKDATVIDGGGRVLMPGLIEAHGHLALVSNPLEMANNRTWDYIGALMGVEAQRYLMRGFTTLRDAGGPVFGLKQLIDEGLISGPANLPIWRRYFSDFGSWRLPQLQRHLELFHRRTQCFYQFGLQFFGGWCRRGAEGGSRRFEDAGVTNQDDGRWRCYQHI